MSDFRVLVTGSRDWGDRQAVFDALDKVLADHAWKAGDSWTVTVVHGDCPSGADKLAHQWYVSRRRLWHDHVREDPNPADWGRLGKAAGDARNQVMADKGAHKCLAFYWAGAANRGTADCVARATVADIPVEEFRDGPVVYTDADRAYDNWAHERDYG